MTTPAIRHDDGTVMYRYCPACAGALSERVLVAREPARLFCGGCGLVLYRDPKLAVGAICSGPEGIVLLRRAIEPGIGKWVFPGGYVDRGETPVAAARREAFEEIEAEIRVGRLLNVYAYEGSPVVVIVYEAVITGDRIGCGDEALEVRSFEPSGIPWEDLAFRSTREALMEYLSDRSRRRECS